MYEVGSLYCLVARLSDDNINHVYGRPTICINYWDRSSSFQREYERRTTYHHNFFAILIVSFVVRNTWFKPRIFFKEIFTYYYDREIQDWGCKGVSFKEDITSAVLNEHAD
jgi:hypothetical protein